MGKTKRKHRLLYVLIALLLAGGIAYFVLQYFGWNPFKEPPKTGTVTSGTIEVHMIDVGQSDCILISAPEGNMLIDAGDGTTAHEAAIKTYLDDHGIKDFEYVIFTHSDKDHIGGGDMVLDNYQTDNVLMPDDKRETVVYNELMAAVDRSGTTFTEAQAGTEYSIGELKFKILAPLGDGYKDVNDYSIVTRIDYGENSFLMTGDAEKNSEAEILSTYSTAELDCDVLKVGHHGSRTSSCAELLDKVTPEIAIISVGEKNSYGHPHDEVISRLNERHVTTYLTDVNGDIVLTADGKEIKVKTAK